MGGTIACIVPFSGIKVIAANVSVENRMVLAVHAALVLRRVGGFRRQNHAKCRKCGQCKHIADVKLFVHVFHPFTWIIANHI